MTTFPDERGTSESARLEEFGTAVAHAADAVRQTSETIAASAQEQTTLMIALAESAGILAHESAAAATRLEYTRNDAQAASRDLAASLGIVGELLSSVQRLAELSNGTAMAMDDFARLMGDIGRMTEFVEDVSDETQLLALNAAIEAARAGQHGLGFAVVAGEVGKLAKTTGVSTAEIGKLVAQIQGQTEKTIATVKAAAIRSAHSAPVAELARASLGEISGLALRVSSALDEAVTISRQHSASADEAKHETERLASMAAEQGRQALEAAFSTQRLGYYGAEMIYVARPSHGRQTELTTIRCATLIPPGYAPSIAWEHFKKRVEELGAGRLQVELQVPFAGSELEALMRVRSGELDMASVSVYIASSLVPFAQIFDLPFLFATAEDAHKVLDRGLGRRVLQSFESFGVTGLGFFENGIRHFTNNLREITKPKDLQGMRMRIQDSVVYLALMHALEASPKVMPFTQLRDALAAGLIDGQENPLQNIVGMNIHEVQKYLTLTAHIYNTQVVLGNSEMMRRLSDEDRFVVQTALADATKYHRDFSQRKDSEALTLLQHSMQVRQLTPQERGEFVRAAHSVWERMQPVFPDDVFDLLVGGDLASYQEEANDDWRSHQQSFAISDIVSAIDSAVQAVRTTAGQATKNAEAQRSKLEHLGARCGAMSDRNNELASGFDKLSLDFATAQDDIMTTRITVDGLAASVEALASMAIESREALKQFSALMKQISEIIAIVRDVSDKTNLLALNAAIEAARAGEHGKGFNVVATEVRNLADKTRSSTQQMRGVLADLDARGKAAAAAIQSGAGEAAISSKRAAAAEDALSRIGSFVDEVIETLHAAKHEAITEAQRAFGIKGDLDEMAVLVAFHGQQGTESVQTAADLERQRAALLGI